MSSQHLTLMVPGLVWPDAELRAEATRDLALPALAWLLGRGQAQPASTPASPWLARLLGVAASLPVARRLAQADGLAASQGHWLCADPVHLRVEQDSLLLADAQMFSLTQAEANALVATLNQHFAEDGLVFHAAQPTRWYLQLSKAADAGFTPLGEVVAQSIDPHLPHGPRASQWRHWLNELQMLLFSHPVNEAREAAGQPVINSIWPWGGGEAGTLQLPASTVYTDQPLLAALAAQAGATVDTLPAQAGPAWLGEWRGEALVWLDGLSAAVSYQDGWAWRNQLLALEQHWFAPLAAALKARQLTTLTLHVPGEAGLSATLRAGDSWKFWRGARQIATF